MNRKPSETPESKKLRERAAKCHRLAVGVDDLQFTLKLNARADEYEAKAVQADAKAASDKKYGRQLAVPPRGDADVVFCGDRETERIP